MMSNTSKIILGGALAVILVIAAMKNPSKVESELMIRDEVGEEIIEQFPVAMTSLFEDDEEESDKVLDFLMSIAAIKTLNVDVTDYAVFSTFEVTIEKDDCELELSYGLILFGNVIPFSVDVEPVFDAGVTA